MDDVGLGVGVLLHVLPVARRQVPFGLGVEVPVGALFKRIVEIPGFSSGSYLQFLTPGVLVMTALFSSGWSGMGFIEDIDRGIMDRFLVSPVRRAGLTVGSLAYQGITTVIQSVIMIALAVAVGARFPGGVAGGAVAIGAAVLLAVAFASLSNALGLLMRQRESLIAAVQFVVLPLSFLSSAFLQQNLAPSWIQHVARYNPVNWAVEAGRVALGASADWGLVGWRMGLLAAFAVACAWVAPAPSAPTSARSERRFARHGGPPDVGGPPSRVKSSWAGSRLPTAGERAAKTGRRPWTTAMRWWCATPPRRSATRPGWGTGSPAPSTTRGRATRWS